MAKTMQGRAENDIKNKWYSMKRKENRLEGLRLQGLRLHDEKDLCSLDDDEMPDTMLSADPIDYFTTAGFSQGKNAADLNKTDLTFV
jgi:hypothetical protein